MSNRVHDVEFLKRTVGSLRAAGDDLKARGFAGDVDGQPPTDGEIRLIDQHLQDAGEYLRLDQSNDAIYLPNNQALALIQSAMDETSPIDDVTDDEGFTSEQFDPSDPHWIQVAWEKLKALVRGPHKFVAHKTSEDFRTAMPNDAVVALLSDWGTGGPHAIRVGEVARRANPTELIHLGDVYYSGTRTEIKRRFLDVLDRVGFDHRFCRRWALNSNHEMYSGGYGYFDLTLKTFNQPASYFSVENDHWRIIGLDSGYEDHGLQHPQKDWLIDQIMRPDPKRTILLTHHQLFSAYEDRPAHKPLERKMVDVVAAGRIFAWFWGHEHRPIVYQSQQSLLARCVGHGAIPFSVPFGRPKTSTPVEKVDEREFETNGGRGLNGGAILKFVDGGTRVEVQYVAEDGSVWHEEMFP